MGNRAISNADKFVEYAAKGKHEKLERKAQKLNVSYDVINSVRIFFFSVGNPFLNNLVDVGWFDRVDDCRLL